MLQHSSFANSDNKITNYYPHGLGQRSSKNSVIYMYDLEGHLIGEYTNTGALIQETVWLNDLPIATIRPNGTGISVYFIHADELGTPRVVTDTTNKPVWRWDGDAFGRGLPNQDPLKTGVKFVYHLRYPGQYYDTESGLHYNYFRDYDPETGRYIQSDPIGLAGGFNTYAYVGGNPFRWVDPLGLEVTRWARPADLGPGGVVGVFIDHHWLKTSALESGMGPINGQIPAQNGESSLPGVPVQTTNHAGQSKAPNSRQVPIPFLVNERCVNSYLGLNRSLGDFGPRNNCQTFVDDVLQKCKTYSK